MNAVISHCLSPALLNSDVLTFGNAPLQVFIVPIAYLIWKAVQGLVAKDLVLDIDCTRFPLRAEASPVMVAAQHAQADAVVHFGGRIFKDTNKITM